MAVRFTLNGKPQTVETPPSMPLLWVLRDTLGMTGTKFGCGMALCGACTVHIDGRPARACVTPISSVASKQVTTIEGLSPERAHPIQKAWIAEDVPQCGYCQSGQIMTAAALLPEQQIPPTPISMKRCGTTSAAAEHINRFARRSIWRPNSSAREVLNERRGQ